MAGRVIYNTATSLDGYLADSDNSLGWLFAVPSDEAAQGQRHRDFMAGVGVLVEGSLGGGAPLLPRRIESDRLQLVSAAADGQFVRIVYAVLPPDGADG